MPAYRAPHCDSYQMQEHGHLHAEGCTCNWSLQRPGRIEQTGCPVHDPAQPPAEKRAELLATLERQQATVDAAQAEYDVARDKANKASRTAQGKYSTLEAAKERRDAALADLEKALPARDPEPEMYPVEVTGR